MIKLAVRGVLAAKLVSLKKPAVRHACDIDTDLPSVNCILELWMSGVPRGNSEVSSKLLEGGKSEKITQLEINPSISIN